MEDWALIRQLHLAEGVPQAQIARQLGLSRNTVARALRSEGPPVYRQPPRPSAFDGYEARVRAILGEFPSMPASVIAERLGWPGSESWFRKPSATCGSRRTGCPPGTGEWDSFPVLVVVASYSRFITARMLPTRRTPDLLAGMWSLLSGQLGAVPRRLVWDNEAGIGRRNILAEGVAGFCGSLATRIVQLKPFDPESKGIVERANRFLETSFLPGRRFQGPEDFNAQLGEWLVRANQRTVRALGARPADLLELDRRSMLPLPALDPPVGFRQRIRVARDYYTTVLGNDYSIDPIAIDRLVEVHADLDRVRAQLDGMPVADHRRSWGRNGRVTDPEHVRSAARLRTAFQQPRPRAIEDAGILRDLAEYDAFFGIAIDEEPIP
ncbi:IS21 family transposase [Sinomonas sp. JGH33]|uniref:IS21 family transposase n=1 Tax=Sinomonas terricola TaxID=3110330 RepID=A0ABU5TBA3_9MICC|nr:helix-turn-helix domain-containing protein [Sinomonas sp. JGH33]MEA5456977.1 IS21 family transposase [Sinomonas sp. JGH33]